MLTLSSTADINDIVSSIVAAYVTDKITFDNPLEMILNIFEYPIRHVWNPSIEQFEAGTLSDDYYISGFTAYMNTIVFNNNFNIQTLLTSTDNHVVLPGDYIDTTQYADEMHNSEVLLHDADDVIDDITKLGSDDCLYIVRDTDLNVASTFACNEVVAFINSKSSRSNIDDSDDSSCEIITKQTLIDPLTDNVWFDQADSFRYNADADPYDPSQYIDIIACANTDDIDWAIVESDADDEVSSSNEAVIERDHDNHNIIRSSNAFDELDWDWSDEEYAGSSVIPPHMNEFYIAKYDANHKPSRADRSFNMNNDKSTTNSVNTGHTEITKSDLSYKPEDIDHFT